MYGTVRDPLLSASGQPGTRWARVSRNVLLLGFTSLFTDISSEMMTAILPLYFVLELKMTPLQFGVIDGLYQGVSALVRVASGLVADAGRRYKQVAVLGYGLSVACKGGLLVVGSAWTGITALLMLDRLGKGIRTAPRDALITLSSDRTRLGEAFGAHRAMDTVGAVIGPVAAFGVLALVPGDYRAVFVVSLAFGLIGLAIIGLFVQNVRGARQADRSTGTKGRLQRAVGNARLRTLIAAGAVLGMLTTSDALIYLLIQRQGSVSPTLFPLLFVGTSLTYLLLAFPVGRLADRVGRHRLFVLGHLPVVAIYAVLLLLPALSVAAVVVSLLLLGVYYAATDGVLAALAGSVLDGEQVTTGLALVSTVWAVARLFAAALFGAAWTWIGADGALGVFLAGLVVAVCVAGWFLRVDRRWHAVDGMS